MHKKRGVLVGAQDADTVPASLASLFRGPTDKTPRAHPHRASPKATIALPGRLGSENSAEGSAEESAVDAHEEDSAEEEGPPPLISARIPTTPNTSVITPVAPVSADDTRRNMVSKKSPSKGSPLFGTRNRSHIQQEVPRQRMFQTPPVARPDAQLQMLTQRMTQPAPGRNMWVSSVLV